MHSKSKSQFLSPYSILAWILFLIFLLNPQFVFFKQDSDFYIPPLTFLSFGLVSFVILLIFSSILYRSLHMLIGQKFEKVNVFLVFVFYFILISILSPIILENHTDMYGLNHHVNPLILVTNLLASFFVLKQFHKNKLFFKSLSFVLVITFIAFSFLNFNKLDNGENPTRIFLGQKNLIVISLDGIPGKSFNKIITSHENKKFFKDFTNYKNSFSHEVATWGSLFTELYGAPDWKLIANDQSDLKELNESFKEKNYFMDDSYVYGKYAKLAPKSSIRLDPNKSKESFNQEKSIETISSSLCSWGFCILGKKYGNFKNYFNYVYSKFFIEDNDNSHILSLQDLNSIVESFEKSAHPEGVFIGHFFFGHYPIKFDKNCSYVGEKFIKQNEESIDELTECAILIIKKIITQLLNSGLYDNSYIVFKSDHGKPRSYYKNGIQSLKVNGHDLWGYDRFRPFVLVKKPLAVNDELTHKEQPFFLSDLRDIYTLFRKNKSLNKNYLNSIESSEIVEQINNKKTFIFIPKNEESDFKFDSHVPLEIGRESLNSIEKKILEVSK